MSASPTDRVIRLGVAGLGRAFTLMLPTLLQDRRVQLVAACDPREEARSQFERDFEAPTYADIEGLAKDASVEAIYIASPHQFHAAQTRVAALHGKHVLVEKPMALTLAECDDMIAHCREGGVQLIVGHCHSFDSPYLRAREIVSSGEFGRVRMIHALNYTDFLYRPRRPEELRTEAGGGVVFSQAAHQVDVVRLLAGQSGRSGPSASTRATGIRPGRRRVRTRRCSGSKMARSPASSTTATAISTPTNGVAGSARWGRANRPRPLVRPAANSPP